MLIYIENDKKIKNFIKTTIREFLNEQSLKGAVDFERNQRLMSKKKQDKIKWFDDLDFVDKQRLHNEYKGRKRDLVWITDEDKVAIYNKEHNGGYTNY